MKYFKIYYIAFQKIRNRRKVFILSRNILKLREEIRKKVWVVLLIN